MEMHDGVFMRSVYFFDPDGLSLEFACWLRATAAGRREATCRPGRRVTPQLITSADLELFELCGGDVPASSFSTSRVWRPTRAPVVRTVARSRGELRHDPGHRHGPALVRGQPQHHLARRVVRVGHHVGRGEDPPGGHAGTASSRSMQLLAVQRRWPTARSAHRAPRCARRGLGALRTARRMPARGDPSRRTAGRRPHRRWRRSGPRCRPRRRRRWTARRRAARCLTARGSRHRSRSRPSSTPSAPRPPRRSRRRPPGHDRSPHLVECRQHPDHREQ